MYIRSNGGTSARIAGIPGMSTCPACGNKNQLQIRTKLLTDGAEGYLKHNCTLCCHAWTEPATDKDIDNFVKGTRVQK